ncbi:MAG TPA: GGDEF domain-containing protein [Candidatus Paceibacterota bacterium]
MDEVQKLKSKILKLETQVRELEKDLIHDSLTGLKTRAFFEQELSIYLIQIEAIDEHLAKRKDWFGFKNLSVLFFDIDHFKKINDTYGHDVGDKALKEVAKVIKTTVSGGDTVARWGGEEIVSSLLGASEADAKTKAELIRKNVEKINFADVPDLKVTVSIGISSNFDGATINDLIKNADKALYRAKQTGRNKVIVFSELQ